MLTEPELRRLLEANGFDVAAAETIGDPSSSSYIPVDYVRARKG